MTIAFSLFVSAAAPSARSAVLLLVAGILILLGLQSAYSALLSIPPTSRFFDALLFIRTILANLQAVLSWFSPFRMLDVILTSSINNDWLALIRQLGISLIATLVWLFAAVRMLRYRGRVAMSLHSLHKHRSRWGLLILLLAMLTPILVFAQATDRQDTFVYGINAAIPDAVIGTFAPPVVDTIYLMSTETSVISPRITSVYYWPITNDYRASWNVLNEVVEGDLEIMRGLQTIETIEQTTYTIHFRQGQGSTARPDLYVGSDAVEANAQFEVDQLAFREATIAYQEARQIWLDNAREAQQQGLSPEEFVVPGPVEPSRPDTYSTGLNSGFPIKLEPGDYRIRTRAADGTIVPRKRT